MTIPHNHPDLVGHYRDRGRDTFFPVKRSELDRAATSIAEVIRSFGMSRGAYVLSLSLLREVAQFAPFEKAVTLAGLIGTNGDASGFDAPRIESIIRQFDVAAICGIDAEVLDALSALGHDPARLLAGRIIWARPSAWPRVAAMPGVIARRCVVLGPVLALECRLGEGAHVDGREWSLAEARGIVTVSSRAYRITTVHDVDSGFRGSIESDPCRCGSIDPRVIFDVGVTNQVIARAPA